MRKFLTIAILTAMIASLGAALAQLSQSHPVEVRIPEVLMIRITDGLAITAVPAPEAVVFDLRTTFEPTGVFSPSHPLADNWNNIRVFSNHPATQSWSVSVGVTGDVFPWNRITVASEGGDFALPLVGQEPRVIFSSSGHTGGWSSLGIGPSQFSLDLDGTEPAGDFRATVTYTITAP